MPTFANIQEEIAAMLDIPDNELTDEQKLAMDQYLDELGAQEADKVDSFASFIRLQTAHAEALKDESARLRDKARACEARLGRLKNHYLALMREHGLKKVTGNAYTISQRKSQCVKAPEDQEDLALLYETDPLFVNRRITYAPDRRVIGEALKGGQTIPGCQLVDNYSLQVR